MDMLQTPILFVVGAPRSGTSWLHQMLAEHPGFAGLGATELTVFSRYLAPWAASFETEMKDNATGKWSQGLPVLFSQQEFEQIMHRFVREVYTKLHERTPGATHLIDKHPNYSNHLPLIDRLLPHSRFIHIVRDGREVAVSMMSARRRVGHSPGEVRGAAREWYRCVTNARAYGAVLGPARYLEVRYEDLMARTALELDRAFAFCGMVPETGATERIAAMYHLSARQVSGGDASLNPLRGRPGAIWQQRLSTRERWIFDHMAGSLLRTLGYAQEGWWVLSPTDRLRMATYGFTARTKRSLQAIRGIWTSPLEEQLHE
jgi:Sulfotransferase family